jgi:hypothetical protein
MLESPYRVGFKACLGTTLLESQMHVGIVKAFKARQHLKVYGRKEYHPWPKFFHCSGSQSFVQTSFTEGIIWVPHCVSNMNTHGSLRVTVLCFALECTRLIKCYVDTCIWNWCTFARLLIHEERIVILFYTVFQTWKHLRHQSWLCCASIMNAQGSLKLTLLCFELECTGSDISMCFKLNTHGLKA